jgi:hypothetical protein
MLDEPRLPPSSSSILSCNCAKSANKLPDGFDIDGYIVHSSLAWLGRIARDLELGVPGPL